jgi:thioredoxin reductase (NADPH)
VEIDNDFVLALTGYEPDVAFLERMGIQVDPETRRPRHDPATFETNVPGLYVAGVICAGNVSSEIFIENGRYHGEAIIQHILRRKQW